MSLEIFSYLHIQEGRVEKGEKANFLTKYVFPHFNVGIEVYFIMETGHIGVLFD